MLAGVMNQPPPSTPMAPPGRPARPGRGGGRRVHEHGIADGPAPGVLDAHRIEDLALHIADEKAGRSWPLVAGPFHEGQQVPEDGEVDVVIVRHLLVRLLDAVPDLFPRRIVGFEDPVAVEAESCPVGQQFTEGDGAHSRAFDPIRGQERRDPAVDAEMAPGQRLQDGNRGEHLADAGDIHHDIRSHGELRWVRGGASKAGGKDSRPANERNVAGDVSLELGIDAVRQPAERNAHAGNTDPIGGTRRLDCGQAPRVRPGAAARHARCGQRRYPQRTYPDPADHREPPPSFTGGTKPIPPARGRSRSARPRDGCRTRWSRNVSKTPPARPGRRPADPPRRRRRLLGCLARTTAPVGRCRGPCPRQEIAGVGPKRSRSSDGGNPCAGRSTRSLLPIPSKVRRSRSLTLTGAAITRSFPQHVPRYSRLRHWHMQNVIWRPHRGPAHTGS